MTRNCANGTGALTPDYPDLLPNRILHVQRLIVLLESSAHGGLRSPSKLIPADVDRLSLLSRLRQAHARYALGSGDMARMGAGAWMVTRAH